MCDTTGRTYSLYLSTLSSKYFIYQQMIPCGSLESSAFNTNDNGITVY